MDRKLASLIFGNEIIYQESIPKIEKVPEISEVKTLEKIQIIDSEPAIYIIVNVYGKSEKVLLESMMKACKVEMEAIKLMDFEESSGFDFGLIFGKNNTIISFGLPMQRLKVDINIFPYQAKINKTEKLLLADSLDKFENDKVLKLKLWTELKKIFNL